MTGIAEKIDTLMEFVNYVRNDVKTAPVPDEVKEAFGVVVMTLAISFIGQAVQKANGNNDETTTDGAGV